MADFVHPLLGDALVNGMALLAVGLVVYLIALRIIEIRRVRQERRKREREKRGGWGYT